MRIPCKPIEQLSHSDMLEHSVWEFMPESEHRDETWVRPVLKTPVRTLAGRIVSTRVRLANGESELALLGNIALDDSNQNEHFLTLSIIKPSGESFDLARYHDVRYPSFGPLALSKFLGLPVGDIFPIEYDISAIAKGSTESLRGLIHKEPSVRLSKAELISMALS